jgi:hypothetical protein
MSKGRSLNRREFDAVIRRAAELSSSEPESGESALTEEELFRIAGEVGLGEGHVRRALAEVRSGVEAGGAVNRTFGPSHVRASRVVPGAPAALATKVDEFLVGTQLLQSVRRGPNILQYRPAEDWASQLARSASSSSRKYYIASSRSVEVQLEPVGTEATAVTFLLDPGMRAEHVAGAIVGGGVGGGIAGGLAALGLSTIAPVALAIGAGMLVGTGAWTGIAFGTRAAYARKLADVTSEVEGVLDALESGASLEPPPPAWRRWVKRHFHGMASDFNWGGGRKGGR